MRVAQSSLTKATLPAHNRPGYSVCLRASARSNAATGDLEWKHIRFCLDCGCQPQHTCLDRSCHTTNHGIHATRHFPRNGAVRVFQKRIRAAIPSRVVLDEGPLAILIWHVPSIQAFPKIREVPEIGSRRPQATQRL